MDKTIEEMLTEEIKRLRSLLQRKEQALAILEGNNIGDGSKNELETNTPISLNSLYEYPKTAPIKRKILAILKMRNSFLRKTDIVTIYLTKEGLKDTEDNRYDAMIEVTNALSNLRTAKRVAGYKPEGIKMKGGLWGLVDFFEDGKPIQQYIPDLSTLSEEEE